MPPQRKVPAPVKPEAATSGVSWLLVVIVAALSATVSALATARLVCTARVVADPIRAPLSEPQANSAEAGASAVPQLIARDPLIWQIDELLSAEECRHLSKLADGKWEESLVRNIDDNNRGAELKQQRASSTFYATDELNGKKVKDAVVLRLLEKIHDAARVPLEYGLGEDLQLTKYTKGGRYTLHPDSTMEMGRLMTVLIFLNDVDAGGETIFPYAKAVDPVKRKRGNRRYEQLAETTGHDSAELDRFCRDAATLKVSPKPGRAVMWYNHLPSLMFNDRSVHAGCPVINGTKRIAQRWIRWFDREQGNMLHSMITAQQSGSHGEL